MGDAGRTTYVLVDGENIDATLGNSILAGRPTPDQRPRWDRIREFASTEWGQPVNGLFFLNASSGSLPMTFVQALLAMGYQPIPLAGNGTARTSVGVDGQTVVAPHSFNRTYRYRRIVSQPFIPSASSTIAFNGNCLPPRCCSSAVMTATAPASMMRSCSDLAEKPPNTTEWVAPMRAQACMAATPWIDIDM